MLKDLKEIVNEIEMPADMRARIVDNCYLEMEKEFMRTHKKSAFFRNPMFAVVSLVLCICVTGISAMAAFGKIQGFFKDITNWHGAVVGTSYEQATEEVQLKIIEAAEALAVEVTFLTPDKAPYLYFEQMGIQAANIADMNGNIIVKDMSSEPVQIQDGKVIILVLLEDLPAGNYKLQISELVGTKKADQPLILYGEWECAFVR